MATVSDSRLRIVDPDEPADDELARVHLAPFAEGTRRFMDEQLHRRRTRPVPPLRLPRTRLRIAVGVGAAIAAVAAIVVLSWVAPRFANEDRNPTPNQAQREQQDVDDGGVAVEPPPSSATAPAEPANEATLEALDAQAQRLWKQGDRAAAATIFREMTRRGGDHRYVELAYADLVTLASQGGHDENAAALWREYLQRFPHGRFAADARAGVLRQRPGGEGTADDRPQTPR